MYSGDPEFCWQNFHDLPYNYVLDAYINGMKFQKKKLHLLEAPAALQTSLLANINRDPKKVRRPYGMEDFCLYMSAEDRNIPSAEFGSAAMALIEKRIFPPWALFAYKDLKEAASGPPPDILCYAADDVIILAPRVTGETLQGMLIALESSSEQVRILTSPCKKSVLIQMPKLKGKVVCEENARLDALIC